MFVALIICVLISRVCWGFQPCWQGHQLCYQVWKVIVLVCPPWMFQKGIIRSLKASFILYVPNCLPTFLPDCLFAYLLTNFPVYLPFAYLSAFVPSFLPSLVSPSLPPSLSPPSLHPILPLFPPSLPPSILFCFVFNSVFSLFQVGSPKERSSSSSVACNFGEEASHPEPTRQLQAVHDHGNQPQGIVAISVAIPAVSWRNILGTTLAWLGPSLWGLKEKGGILRLWMENLEGNHFKLLYLKTFVMLFAAYLHDKLLI